MAVWGRYVVVVVVVWTRFVRDADGAQLKTRPGSCTSLFPLHRPVLGTGSFSSRGLPRSYCTPSPPGCLGSLVAVSAELVASEKNTERRLEFQWFTGPVSWQRASSYCLQVLTVLITQKLERNCIPLCYREPQRPIFIMSERFSFGSDPPVCKSAVRWLPASAASQSFCRMNPSSNMQSTKLVAVVAVWTWFIRDAKQLKTRPGNHKHKDGVIPLLPLPPPPPPPAKNSSRGDPVRLMGH